MTGYFAVNKLTQEEFISRAKKLHKEKFSYKKVVYDGQKKKVVIGCRACRKWFSVTPGVHLRKKGKGGCMLCLVKAKAQARWERASSEFTKKARDIHGELYDYSKVEYKTARTKIEILCRECDVTFLQIPNSHLNGSGCPHCCRPHAHSKSSIKWLEYEAKKRRIKIRHARNGGEFQIPGTRYRADGYHATSKTIFEFYGDVYHGNPKKYKPRSRPHPHNDRTAASLYKETMKREEMLRSLGYNVVTMWQSDFKQLVREGVI